MKRISSFFYVLERNFKIILMSLHSFDLFFERRRFVYVNFFIFLVVVSLLAILFLLNLCNKNETFLYAVHGSAWALSVVIGRAIPVGIISMISRCDFCHRHPTWVCYNSSAFIWTICPSSSLAPYVILRSSTLFSSTILICFRTVLLF